MKPGSPHVVHLTSAHPANDVRIFQKECRSIGAAGYCVSLVAPDAPTHMVDGVRYIPIARAGSRIERMTLGAVRAWRAARRTKADLYQFHDPELLPGALVMVALGKRVVYDAHEEVGADLLDRDYLPRPMRRLVATVIGGFERFVARRVTAVVAATPAIARRHAGARRVVTIANYPRREDFKSGAPAAYRGRPRDIAYVGLISRERGCRQMLDALELLRGDDVRLRLAGPFDHPSLQADAEAHSAWDLVDYRGTIPHGAIAELLNGARAGLVLFLPGPNHIEAQPNKLFEYMASGVPLVASDFPRWRELVAGSGSGVLADPSNPRAIADAIRSLLADESAAERMGENGVQAVSTLYNWEHQAQIMLACYKDLIGAPAPAHAP